jgi:C4-dicarboxylate-specific signal transduction histidine kinase
VSYSRENNWEKSQFSPAVFPDVVLRRFALAPPRAALAASLALVGVIALLDYAMGYEARLSIFYMAPIAFATWSVGRRAGLFLSFAAGALWLASFYELHPYSHDIYYFWEGLLAIATYVLFVVLLARLKEALERSDARFVTVLEGFEGAMFVEGEDGASVLFANRRFREMFGALRPRGLEGQRTSRRPIELRDEATGRWYEVRSRPLRWTDGRMVTLRVLTDISDARRGRELVRKHRDAAHHTARMVALGAFASALAHELNQPLAAIAAYSDAALRLLASRCESPGEIGEALEKTRLQAKRAGDIIARLRGLLHPSARQRGPENLADIALSAARLAEPEAAEAGVVVDLQPGVARRVLADRILIEQVLANLLRNAIEAVRGERPERRRVELRTCASGDAVEVCVSDTGKGIAQAEWKHLFEPFHTTKPGGLGLGLTICRSIVEAHGGALSYAPNAGGGSRFIFTLPCAPS